MMTRIEIEQDTAERLANKANSKGLSVDSLVKSLLDATDSTSQATVTFEELDRVLDELAAGPEDLPPLPAHFSRADIYLDHD